MNSFTSNFSDTERCTFNGALGFAKKYIIFKNVEKFVLNNMINIENLKNKTYKI